MMGNLNLRATIVSLLLLLVLLGIWEALNQPPEATEALSEYELLMGGADEEARDVAALRAVAGGVELSGHAGVQRRRDGTEEYR